MKLYEKESVESKLFRLKEITKILEELRVSSREEFVKDYKLNNIGMFNLLIGVTIWAVAFHSTGDSAQGVDGTIAIPLVPR